MRLMERKQIQKLLEKGSERRGRGKKRQIATSKRKKEIDDYK